MQRKVLAAGLVLVGLGSGIFAWKALVIDLPVLPSPPSGLWQVELEIGLRGSSKTGSLTAALAQATPGQVIFGERFSSGPLPLSIRTVGDWRVAIWQVPESGVREVSYGFRVELEPLERTVPSSRFEAPPADLRKKYATPGDGLPSDDASVLAAIEELDLPPPADTGGRVRELYAFVGHEVVLRGSGAADPLVVLSLREGSALGRARLLATLLRAAGVPARMVRGLELRPDEPRERVWTEAWIGDDWYPMSTDPPFFGRLPDDFLTLGRGDRPLIEARSVEGFGYSFHAIREQLTPAELAALMVPPDPWLRSFSLHRLPVSLQEALRVLLVMPLGALLIALLRNGIGLPSYGTFMPMLIALAFRGTGLIAGLLLVALVVAIGLVGRIFISWLRMLLVPRLALLLCMVILAVTLLSLLGLGMDQGGLYGGILFPIVILTMVIERFSLTMAEEGLGEALKRAAASTLMAVIVYPIFRSSLASHLMFSFPELLFVIMGILVWMGGYTGYRVADLIRFRPLLRQRAS
jgi:hypothetical protein